MAICAGCGSEAAPNLCSRCQRARYCSRSCQKVHWRQHKRECVAAAPSSDDAAGHSGGACPQCAKEWEECACVESPSCWICLESSGKLVRGCACRGTAGYLHIACLVESNRHRANAHAECPTCQTRFVGALSMAVAEARDRDARANGGDIDCAATSDLARACLEQGRYPEALQHYRNVLRRDLERFGPDHLSVAATYANIGNVYKSQGKYLQALEMHQKGLKIEEKIYGPEHLEVAKTQDNIAIVYMRMGKLDKALELSQSALTVMEKVLGRKHLVVADTYNKYLFSLFYFGKLLNSMRSAWCSIGIVLDEMASVIQLFFLMHAWGAAF